MAYNGRKFFSNETVEEKTRKYTKPYPIVTSHLLNLHQSLLNTTSVSWQNSPSHLQKLVDNQRNLFLPQVNSPILHQSTPSPIAPVTPDLNMGPKFPQSLQNRKRRHNNSPHDRQDHIKQRSYVPQDQVKRRRQSDQINNEEQDDKYQKLSTDMIHYYQENQQPEILLQKKLRLRSALLAVFRRQFPNASLHLVGSSCNGFATKSSDADFCVMLTQNRNVDQKYEACYYLKNFQKLLRTMPSIRKIQFIRAKVPILKFQDYVSGCECDVNINNPTGIRNTHLLRTYSKIDNRLSPMVICIKRWAKSRQINDASQGSLSSYSIVLMIIHYLQAGCHPPVFKSLQVEYPEFFASDSDVDQLPMFEPAERIPHDSSPNKQCLGELIEGFFKYFAEDFKWDLFVISIRLGRAIRRGSKYEWVDKNICIEEPFDLTNTARAVYNYERFCCITREFTRANGQLKKNLSIDSIL